MAGQNRGAFDQVGGSVVVAAATVEAAASVVADQSAERAGDRVCLKAKTA